MAETSGTRAVSTESKEPKDRTVAALVPMGSFLGRPDLPLDRAVTTVGSRDSCRLQLESRSISRVHCLLVSSPSGTYIADLASRTGVLVNGQSVQEADLHTGDRVQIGRFTFRYRGALDQPTFTSSPAPPAPPMALAIAGEPPRPLNRRTFLIGRRDNAHLPLPDDADVSTNHAVLFQMDGQWYIRDLASRTGTHVNGELIQTQQPLSFGDTVEIGQTRFELEQGSETAAEPLAEAASDEDSGIDFTDEAGLEPLADLPAVELPLLEEELPISGRAEPEEPDVSLPLASSGEDVPLEMPQAAIPEDQALPESAGESSAAPVESKPPPAAPAADEWDLTPLAPENIPEPSLAAAADAETASPIESEVQPLELAAEEDFELAPPPPVAAVQVEAVESIQAEPAPEAEAEAEPVAIPVEPPANQDTALAEQAEADADSVTESPSLPMDLSDEAIAASEPAGKGKRKRAPRKPAAAGSKRSAKSRSRKSVAEVASASPASADEEVAPEEIAASPIAGPTADAPVEALDVTEPTPESALMFEAAEEPQPAPPAAENEPLMSDTGFGRAVEAFTDPTTGPLVEASAETQDAGGAAPERTLADLQEGEEFVAVPEAEPERDDFAVPTLAVDRLEEAPIIFDETEAESANTDVVAPPAASAPEQSAPLPVPQPVAAVDEVIETLSQETTPAGVVVEPDAIELEPLAQSDAGLAEPAESPVGFALHVPDSLDPSAPAAAAEPFPFAETGLPPADAAEIAPPEPIALSSPAESVPPATLQTAATLEEQTEQIDSIPAGFAQPLAEAAKPAPVPDQATAAPAPSDQDLLLSGPSTAAASAPTSGPGLFGFDFDGGTFLGGLPLSVPMAPPVFDPTEAVGLADHAELAPPDQPASSPPPALAIEPPAESPTPPAPQVPPPGSTPISTLGEDMVVPPLARPTRTPPRQRKPLTTAFDGLTGGSRVTGLVGGISTGGVGPGSRGRAMRSVDVFSQMAEIQLGPSAGGDPYDIPPVERSGNSQPPVPPSNDAQQIAASGAAAPMNAARANFQTNPAKPPEQPARPPLKKKRRWPMWGLLALMLALLAGTWAAVYLLIGPRSRVTGTLTFANLTQQNTARQRQFETEQIARLHSQAVRVIARSQLLLDHVPTGFTDDAASVSNALDGNGSVSFDGPTLTVVCQTGDAADGQAQVRALLAALVQVDADLGDEQRRLAQQAADADAAVSAARDRRENLQAELVSERARGENRPDPDEVAALQAQADRQNRLLAIARSARLDAEAELADLRSPAASGPPDPQTDLQLTRLRWQERDLAQQIHDQKVGPSVDMTADASDSSSVLPAPHASPDLQLLQALQTQAAQVRQLLNQRIAAVAAQQNMTPAQREVARQKEIEELSVRANHLKQTEADYATAAAAVADKVRAIQGRLDAARAATVEVDQLINQITQADTTLKQRSDDATAREQQAASAIALSGQPQESVTPLPDRRPVYAGIISGLVLSVFCGLILSASQSDPAPPLARALQSDAGLDPADSASAEPVIPLGFEDFSPASGSDAEPAPNLSSHASLSVPGDSRRASNVA